MVERKAYKICPIAFAYKADALRQCVGEKCAWSTGSECAILAILDRLEAIRQEIVKPSKEI
jgi:hypothetical protein